MIKMNIYRRSFTKRANGIASALKTIRSKAQSDTEIQHEVEALCLGSKIRKLRQRRSLTLQNVSDLTGLSKSLLSQIENDASAPPIPTLIRIAKALGVRIGHFFRQDKNTERISVVRQQDRQQAVKLPPNRLDRLGYRYVPLAHPLTHQHMEPFWVHIDLRAENEDAFFQHSGEEFIYVLEGRLQFNGGDQTIVVEPGDGLYFDSSLPHRVRNLGPASASALAVIYTQDE